MTRMPDTAPLSIAAHERRKERNPPVLDYDVARTPQQVIAAWQLVHDAYTQAGLIDPNPQRVHTSRHAIHPDTAVIVGRFASRPVSTLTAIHDRHWQLPLDGVYHRELEKLRDQGRRLVEVGLLADRREHVLRAVTAVLEMMRFAYFNAWHFADDIVCGVHPHHVGFYTRYLEFDVVGEETIHPGVKNHPVVLLRLPIREKAAKARLPRGTRMFHRKPLSAQCFEDRAKLDGETLRDTAVAAFLAHKGTPLPGTPVADTRPLRFAATA